MQKLDCFWKSREIQQQCKVSAAASMWDLESHKAGDKEASDFSKQVSADMVTGCNAELRTRINQEPIDQLIN